MNEIEVQSTTLVNVLMNKVNNLTSENLVQASMIEELKMKLIKYEDVTPTQEDDLKTEE